MGGHFLTSRCTDLWSSIPDLQHLQQLTNLHMKVAPDTYGELDSSLCSLSKTPSMLHSLAVEGSDKLLTSPLNVEVPQVLAARLLTQLNLVDCTVRCLSGALADCLQGLTSLSLDLVCSCRCLQTLQLICQGDQSRQGHTMVVVPAGVGNQLKALVLDGIWSTVVDLSFTTSLSTVSLITIDSCNQLCQLALPSSLQSLACFGESLFGIEVNEGQLAPLSHLTRLTLGVDGPNGGCASQRALASPAGVVRLPLLPTSLRHLHLWADESDYIFDFDYVPGQPFVNFCDWHCLDPCTNLERLTVPTCYSLKGQLKAFVQSARHLHIVEYVDEQDDTD